MNYKLKKISGDASFREFYRVKKNKKTSIIVFAKKEKFKNLVVYTAVNEILNSYHILSPKLLKSFYEDNLIEITDFGDRSFYNHIKNKRNKFQMYKKAVDLIIKLQKIKPRSIYRFKKNKIKFKKYTINNLHKESDLFFDWFLKYNLKKCK